MSQASMNPLTGRPTAVVTGAGSGIGQAAARLLAQKGYDVALVGRTKSKLEQTAALCSEADAKCQTLILPCDITKPQAAAEITSQISQQWGRLDALFNIAGSAPMMPISQITAANWQACVDSNLSGAVLLTAAVWPLFIKQGAGFVGNVSSMASIDPFPGLSMYAAAKTGLNMFTHCTAQEGQDNHIRAVAIAPGAVETSMLRTLFSKEQLGTEKTLSPEVVAKALCDCLTCEREFTPGQTIVMNSPE